MVLEASLKQREKRGALLCAHISSEPHRRPVRRLRVYVMCMCVMCGGTGAPLRPKLSKPKWQRSNGRRGIVVVKLPILLSYPSDKGTARHHHEDRTVRRVTETERHEHGHETRDRSGYHGQPLPCPTNFHVELHRPPGALCRLRCPRQPSQDHAERRYG